MRRRRRRSPGWGGFAPYVTKAEKLRRAASARAELAKKGMNLEPVVVEGRAISRTWWGKAWAANLERYADYANRIPRGRTYVRSGAVLDLKITPGSIGAMVSGSRSRPYSVEIGIKPLPKKVESSLIKKSCSSLHSMHDLLAGKFPEALKEEFFKRDDGLFPSPGEIELGCSCPDWAEMCKHVAAVLYGVAARLDKRPELFFVLRTIEIEQFVGKAITRESKSMLKRAAVQSERVIAADDADMAEMFGIEMDPGSAGQAGRESSGRVERRSTSTKVASKRGRPKKKPAAATGTKPLAGKRLPKSVREKKATTKKTAVKKAGTRKRGVTKTGAATAGTKKRVPKEKTPGRTKVKKTASRTTSKKRRAKR